MCVRVSLLSLSSRVFSAEYCGVVFSPKVFPHLLLMMSTDIRRFSSSPTAGISASTACNACPC